VRGGRAVTCLALRPQGDRGSECGADGGRLPLRLNVIIFIAVVRRWLVSLCAAGGCDFGSTQRWRRLSCGTMGAPVGAPFPGALGNDRLLMLCWVTAGFGEAALGFKGSMSLFSQDLLRRERYRSAAPTQTLNLAVHLHPPWLLTPGCYRAALGAGCPPTMGPRGHTRWVLGPGTTSPGTAGTPNCPAWLGAKHTPASCGAQQLPPSPGEKAPVE